jgi:two-component system sensor histidine kinase VicK
LSNINKSHDLCLDSRGPSVVLGAEPVKNAFIAVHNRGAKIRLITEITSHNLSYCKEFMKFAELRHLDNVRGNFSVSDGREYTASATTEEGKPPPRLIYSNVREIAEQHQYFFETLWGRATPAEQRAKEVAEGIKDGVEPAKIEIIHDPRESLQRAWRLVSSARQEVQLMFSTANAFRRQLKMGGMDVITKAVSAGAKVKILIPDDEMIEQTLARAKEALPAAEIRTVDKSLQTRITILVSDQRECMVFELRDDTKDDSYEAVGVTTYSNSHSLVSSYSSIFGSLWKQSELYEQLKVHDKMQKEFINIAAHELRTPVQPILVMTELLESSMGERREDIRLIARNARRLERLTENILDITRIESQSLKLEKEPVNLKDVVLNVLEDYEDQIKAGGVRVNYQPDNVFVQGDKERLSQVLSNLVGNALKFTHEGAIDIAVEKKGQQMTVSVRDTGDGVDSEMLPRLFMKFATKSEKGTGLGLYISKSIIEAHGGKIWAENNKDKGATFTFSLPSESG